MATLAQLKSKVLDVISDSNVRITSIVNYLNSGVTDIAAGLPSAFGSFLTPPLPGLFTIGTVTTASTAAYVSMPTTFQRDLVFAADENGVEIDIADSWIEFAETEPLLDRDGRIYEVIEMGGNLYYQGIPAADQVIGSDSLNYSCILDHTAAAANYPITGVDYATYWSQTGSAGSTWVTGSSYSTGEDITVHFYRLPVAMSDSTDEPDGIPSNFQEKLLVNYAAYRTFELLGKDQKAVYYENAFKKALYDFELSLPFDARSLSLA